MNTPKRLALLCFLILTCAFHAKSQIRYAPAEFFIEVPSAYQLRVSLGDDTISSRNSRFRFFEVRSGRQPLHIRSGQRTLFRGDVFITPGMRTIATLTGNRLRVLEELNLERYTYDSWNTIVGNTNLPDRPTRGRPYRNYLPLMSPSSYDQLKQSISRAGFDKDKLSMIDLVAGNSAFTVEQLSDLIKLFSFSDAKVEVVRKLIPTLADPEHAYQLLDAFPFSSDRDKVREMLMRN